MIRTGKLAINLNTRSVAVDGRRVHVTEKEYSILELLSLRKGTTLTKEMILDHLYGGIDEPQSKIIDVFITKLRKKLVSETGGDHYIEFVRGRGYVLRDPIGNVDHRGARREFSSYSKRPVREVFEEAITIIDSEFMRHAKSSLEELLSDNILSSIEEIKEDLMRVRTQLSKRANAFEHIKSSDLLVIADCPCKMYMILHRTLETAWQHQHAHSVEANIAVPEGNVVRSTGSGASRWISDVQFSSDAFNVMADFSKCLNFSETQRQKLFCNLAFLIEIVRSASSIVAQLHSVCRKEIDP